MIRELSKRIKLFISIALLAYLITLIGAYNFTYLHPCSNDFATVVFDKDGKVINATVSQDQQWRIQNPKDIPQELKISLIHYEDRFFYWHPGVNPISIIKAALHNWKVGKAERGGSTLTMQLARILMGNQKRSYLQKLKEIILAVSLEIRFSKSEILNLYLQHAPFGGNQVGYMSAALRYYNKQPKALSWSEAATLAVLPNAPGIIFPSQEEEVLLQKRNGLLQDLLNKGCLDSLTYLLSLTENVPRKIFKLPLLAPHFTSSHIKQGRSTYSSLDINLQAQTEQILEKYINQYQKSQIYNSAAIIIDNQTGKLLAYVGNIEGDATVSGKDVDILTSLRSPGSTLKPFLYERAMDAGLIHNQSLLQDVPRFFDGFSPSNYDQRFRGVIPADVALAQSLNVPATDLLRAYGVAPFLQDINDLGILSIDESEDHYGLSLILGGAELTPLELAGAYMNLARIAQAKKPLDLNIIDSSVQFDYSCPIEVGSAYFIVDALKRVIRPKAWTGWEKFSRKKHIAWKTGTSYGYRDAWAVGVSPAFTVLVWVGNADGQGQAGCTGRSKAGPILFELFEKLKSPSTFDFMPMYFKQIAICANSGFQSGPHCPVSNYEPWPVEALSLKLCPYHHTYVLDSTSKYRVHHNCYPLEKAVQKSMFVLPPKVNWYQQKITGKNYSEPPMDPNCKQDQLFEIFYPETNAQIQYARNLLGEEMPFIASASGPKEEILYWFLNGNYVDSTFTQHKIEFKLKPGEYELVIQDKYGGKDAVHFDLLDQ